ncbi:MAG: hypothetical protein ABIR79_24055 [Candidatus Binatia bacterium]
MTQRSGSTEPPDTMLPVQFFDRMVSSDTPEKRLMFAVLLDAIVQLRRGDTPLAIEAERWIRDEVDGVAVSFPDACDVLGFETEQLARGLLSWRAQSDPRELPSSQRRVTPHARLRRRNVRTAGRMS